MKYTFFVHHPLIVLLLSLSLFSQISLGQANTHTTPWTPKEIAWWDAIKKQHIHKIKELLKAHPQLLSSQKREDNPLSYAAKKGYLHVVLFLLEEERMKPDSLNARGETPLLLACEYGHFDVVALLLAYNANVAAQNEHGHTCLHFAVAGRHKAITAILLTYKANPNTPDDTDRYTPMHYCAINPDLHIAKLLLLYGGKPDSIANHNSETPIDLAKRSLCHDIVLLFEQHLK